MLGRTEEPLEKNKDCSLLRAVSHGDPQKQADDYKDGYCVYGTALSKFGEDYSIMY